MSLLKTIKYIVNHPLNRKNKIGAIWRFAAWQLRCIFNQHPFIYPFTDRAKLVIQKGMTGATGNLYCGLHEFNEMGFILHFLRPNDFFVDVGANIGSYTILASAHVGARSIAIEPIRETYDKLTRNIKENSIDTIVYPYNIAVGSKNGTIAFTSKFDTMNHVALDGENDSIEVKMEMLDDIIDKNQIPALLKIDVEGFETEVINGANKLMKEQDLKAIIIELAGAGANYGFDESKLHDKLLSLGFQSYLYNPIERKLIPMEIFGKNNTLYVRDLDFVQKRVNTAPKIRVRNMEF